MRLILPFLVCISIFLTDCSRQRPTPDVDEQLVNAYADLLILNEQYKPNAFPRDSTSYQKQVMELLSSYGLERDQLYDHMADQVRSMEEARAFFERLHAILEQRKTKTSSEGTGSGNRHSDDRSTFASRRILTLSTPRAEGTVSIWRLL